MSDREITVRFFASLVDQTGTAELTLKIDPERTAAEVWEQLCESYPKLRQIGFTPLIACDMEFSSPDTRLGDTSELAFLPPVSGG